MLEIINALLPIGLLMVLGMFCVWTGLLDQTTRQGLDRFVYWIALPTAIFWRLTRSAWDAGDAGRLILVMVTVTIAALVLGLAAARALGHRRGQCAVMAQTAFRGNLMFVGLPVVLFLFHGQDAMTSVAILTIAPLILLYNIAAVLCLTIAGGQAQEGTLKQIVKPLVTNPLILACIAGMLMSWAAPVWPEATARTFELVGRTASPLALIALGAALVSLPIRGSIPAAVIASLLKTVACPLLLYLLGRAVGLEAGYLRVGLVLASTPTAVASYVLASQLGGDTALAATGVVVSTILALPVMAVVLWLV